MKNLDLSALTRALGKNKYLLLALALGCALLLLPRRTERAAAPDTTAAPAVGDPLEASGIPLDAEGARLAALLGSIRGVGAAEVLLSARGCVVVCEGAESPAVRLNVTEAVAAYTGLSSNHVFVMKMK